MVIGDDCILDVSTRTLVKDGTSIQLSLLQFRILHYLAQHLNQPVRHEELMQHVWGKDSNVTKSELHVYINRLRKRIERDPLHPQCLMSLRGFGYVLYPRLKVET
ncbi:winged helix-turn-helix domain-containing protein [Alicyclobacillus tolerans]|uniref:winged helix-turn-helix domain-containing protein n=1 Tax=Alicyclobacillus tolerans TaxID=90970 RepID=UPI003558F7E7|nr:winged helix-turn-helix domain-containing protein [Alicyclobacillus tolerans]